MFKSHPITIKFKSLCLITTELSPYHKLFNRIKVFPFCTPQLYRPTICVGTVKCKSSLHTICAGSRVVQMNFLKNTLRNGTGCGFLCPVVAYFGELKRVMVNRGLYTLPSISDNAHIP